MSDDNSWTNLHLSWLWGLILKDRDENVPPHPTSFGLLLAFRSQNFLLNDYLYIPIPTILPYWLQILHFITQYIYQIWFACLILDFTRRFIIQCPCLRKNEMKATFGIEKYIFFVACQWNVISIVTVWKFIRNDWFSSYWTCDIYRPSTESPLSHAIDELLYSFLWILLIFHALQDRWDYKYYAEKLF